MNRIGVVLIVALAFLAGTVVLEAKTKVSKDSFGKLPDGTAIDIYTLSDGPTEVRITNYGGVVVSIKVPDKSGKSDDVVLGFDNVDGYYKHFNNPGNAFLGAIIGRYANRIANGTFTLNGKEYDLPKNDGPNTLHSGTHGFNNVVWTGKQIANGVELNYLSKDGESGFPGNLNVTVRYTLMNSALRIEYAATTDKDTVLNLTNHSYFNLAGQGNGDILKHQMTIHASRFTPVNALLIPTGKLESVDSTPLDFRKPNVVGTRIDANNDQLKLGHGYDHNWVLDAKGGKVTEAAEVYEPTSGRVLKVLTDQPGVQFYSGNFLDGTVKGKEGKTYVRRGGLCLETQHFPDSPNQPNFPTTTLKAGQKFSSVTVFSFSTK